MNYIRLSKNLPVLSVIFFTFLFSLSVRGFAAVSLNYLPDKANVKNIVLENDVVRYTILFDKGVELTSVVEKTTGTDFLAGNPPLMFCTIGRMGSYLYSVEENKTGEKVSLSVTQHPRYGANTLVVTQTFSLGAGPELDWKIEALNTSPPVEKEPLYPLKWTSIGKTVTSWITFPLMQKMVLGSESETHCLFPGQGSYFYYFCIDSPETSFMYWTDKDDPRMPIDIFSSRLERGIYFQINKSKLDFSFSDKNDFRTKAFSITQKPGEQTEILDCRIVPHQGDWHAAFAAFKKHVRSGFDFTYYQRPIQQDYRRRPVGHFTFLYDLEIYDPETNRFRIDEFLDEGELNFGGYDFLLLWHNYPRLGIDQRDQFDVLESLPGGLEGLRKLVDRAHARGVKVFFSYNPWDIMRGRRDHARQCARALKAIGGDGLYLDTMKETDITFREALDAVNPDIIYMTENRPNLQTAAMITGSWQERAPTSNKMPTVDLLRFVIPEHIVYNTLRAIRNREDLIYNALFNGNGIFIWEDNFGDIALVPPHERVLIHRYNRIIRENRDAFLTDNPIPLVADFRDDLYVNAFPTTGKCVYPAYQDDREKAPWESKRLIGPFMEVEHPDNWHYVDVWNHRAIPLKKENGKTQLLFPEEPTGPLSCIVGMPENLKVEQEGEALRITVIKPVENASIQLNTVNNLTWMEEEVLKLEGTSGIVQIARLNLDSPYLVLVKLMQGDVLRDEVVLDLGWKKL